MMSHKDEEDLDTWLYELDMAKDYIHKLSTSEIDVKQFDEKQKKIEQEK